MTVINEIRVLEEIKDLLQRQIIYNKDMLTLNEATYYLDVSKSFLHKLTSQNKISYFKPAGKIYFKKSTLDDWMLQNEHQSINQMNSQMENYLKRPNV